MYSFCLIRLSFTEKCLFNAYFDWVTIKLKPTWSQQPIRTKEIITSSQWNSKFQHANFLKHGIKTRLVLVLNLIGGKRGGSFDDQSQSKVKPKQNQSNLGLRSTLNSKLPLHSWSSNSALWIIKSIAHDHKFFEGMNALMVLCANRTRYSHIVSPAVPAYVMGNRLHVNSGRVSFPS